MKLSKGKPLYIVIHVEIMGGLNNLRADEMVFHVASSLKKAEAYVKENHGIDSYSWWQIVLIHEDTPEDFVHVGYYGVKGGKLKEAPVEKAVAQYRKCLANPKHHLFRGCCSTLTDKLFPNLPRAPWCAFGLDEETKLFIEAFHDEGVRNPFLCPHMQESFVQAYQRSRNSKYSWGGYLEDRTVFMSGQYQKPGEVTHRGVDYNVPVDTEVSVPVPGKLVHSHQDPDQDGGWGGKLIFEHTVFPLYFILGHLKYIVTEERVYQPGEIVGRIAEPALNGNWYPHLHVQCVGKRTPLDKNVDGYGPMYKGIEKDFPNPEFMLNIQAAAWAKTPKNWKNGPLQELTDQAQELKMGYES